MVDNLFPADAVAGAPLYSGRKLRQTGSPLMSGATATRPLGARSGVRPGTSVTTVTATATAWGCGPLAGTIDLESAAEAGPYQFSFDSTASGAFTAFNSSNPRKDILWIAVDDPAENDGTTVPAIRRGYTAGVAAAQPVAPAPPARAFAIAEFNVPVAGGGVPSVTWLGQYCVSAGGILPVSTLAKLTPLVGHLSQYADVYADPAAINNGLYAWAGTAWKHVIGDSGWFTPTMNTGWVSEPNETVQCKWLNGKVEWRGRMHPTTTAAAAGSALTVPAAYQMDGYANNVFPINADAAPATRFIFTSAGGLLVSNVQVGAIVSVANLSYPAKTS